MDWGQVLLVVESIAITFDLLGERSEVSKRIRCTADDVLVVAGGSTAVIHHILTLCLRSQTLIAAKESEWIDRDDFTFLESRRRNDLELQIMITLSSIHHFSNELLIIL